jgi:hypothetical protein
LVARVPKAAATVTGLLYLKPFSVRFGWDARGVLFAFHTGADTISHSSTVRDALHAPIRFHDLRSTGLTWMGARGDAPLAISWRGGHTDFKTTQRYIEQGQKLAAGFGRPFPPLPSSLYDVDYDAEPKFAGNAALKLRPQRDTLNAEPCSRRACRVGANYL